MARIEDHLEAELDQELGKAPELIRSPWTDAQPGQRGIDRLTEKARRVRDGLDRFTREERDEALARLILGGG